MTTFNTNPGVKVFETCGPNGLLRVEAGKPLTTTDSHEIAILSSDGAHALTKSDGAARHADEKEEKGGDKS